MSTVAGRSAVPMYPQLGQIRVFRRTRRLSVPLSPNNRVGQPHPRDQSLVVKGPADSGALGLRGDTHNHDKPMGGRDVPMVVWIDRCEHG
jgi:hypothetical protein